MKHFTLGKSFEKEFEIQQRYYAETADNYDEMHVLLEDEHNFALAFLVSYIRYSQTKSVYSQTKSVLDIGSGTGRVLRYIKAELPNVKVIGIEPSKELREIGYKKHGISEEELIDGNGLYLDFEDESFDIVCEFGSLHHIKYPHRVVDEMLRVAQTAIFISDCNNFGHGSFAMRTIKQLINSVGLWPVADYMKTKGKSYTISEGDGLAYSYSVFNNYRKIKKKCSTVHLLNTKSSGVNLYKTAGHVALLGIKD